MSDNPLNRIPNHDRISVRAVIVSGGEDPGPALMAAGITDPIAVPVVFGEGEPEVAFGDGFTPNVTAVLEPDQEGDGGFPQDGATFGHAAHDVAGGAGNAGTDRQLGPVGGATPGSDPGTVNLPAAYGLSPLAPVRRPG